MSREAMKLALEALEAGEYYIDDLEAIVYAADDLGTHEDRAKMQAAIVALREALANEALDKKAENARELGLDYEPVCNKDPQGCWNVRCQLGKKCKEPPAQQGPVVVFREIKVGEYVLRFWPSDNGWMCGITSEMMQALAEQPAQHPKTKQISECLAVLRPTVKGKFPHEQALEELVGYIASPQPAQRKPLTLGQKQKLWSSVGHKPTLKDRVNAYGFAIEAAHGIGEKT